MLMPLSRRIFSVTGTGPVSMMVGSVPILAVARMRARGLRPSCSPSSLLPIRTAAAPSTMPEMLPCVVNMVNALKLWVLEDRDLIKAGHDFAHLLERGVQRAEALHIWFRGA